MKKQKVRFYDSNIPKTVTGDVVIINNKLAIDIKSYLILEGQTDDFKTYDVNGETYHHLSPYMLDEIYVPVEFNDVINLNKGVDYE